MRVGIVFHKSPLGPPTGIDLVRLRALSSGLLECGMNVEVLAPVEDGSGRLGDVPVVPLSALRAGARYDVVKTCYHFSIRLIDGYRGPVVARIVRVVDESRPERDACRRSDLLQCQDLILRRASGLVLNNRDNADRWRCLYGVSPPITLIPTGCPAVLPPMRSNPFGLDGKVMLFLGSIAAPRMVGLLNEAARRLRGRCTIHVVGANKARLYGGGEQDRLAPEIVQHGEIPEKETWDFVRYAHIGLALAAGPDVFDNDLSKIYSYLRGGLPVLSEEHVANSSLAIERGIGAVFRHGDPEALASKAVGLLEHPPVHHRASTMEWMAREHSWDRRVQTLAELLTETARTRPRPRGSLHG